MKKKIIGIVLCMILITSVISVTGEQLSHKDKTKSSMTNMTEVDTWSMFRHNLDHTAFTSSPGPKTNNLIWSEEISIGLVRSSPAIVEEKIFVGADNFYCLDSNTGVEVWSYPTNDYVMSSPAVVDDRVFFGSHDGNVYCLDAIGIGEGLTDLIWSFQTGDWVISSPVVLDDKVYIGSHDGNVYCLDAIGNGDGTTNVDWSYPTNGSVESSPAINNGKLYIGSNDNKLYCLDVMDGTLIWEFSSSGEIRSSPSVVGDYIYVGSDDGNLYCLYASNGTFKWQYDAGLDVSITSPAVAYDKVYFCTMAYNGRLICLDASDGSLIWENITDFKIQTSPAVAYNKIYVGMNYNEVCCFDAFSGDEIWNYKTNGLMISSPSISDGKLFIGSDDGNVYAFEDLGYPPEDPVIISGPNVGGNEIVFNFSAVADHPFGYQIYYMWDWGDGNITDWIGPFEPGVPVTENHNWTDDGDYEILVKVKDINNNESNWSKPYTISIASQIEFSNLKLGFIYLRTFFSNNSYAYIYLLETFGLTAVLSDMGFSVEATATDAVETVTFELIDLLWEDQINQEDDNVTDGFSAFFEISTGIFQLTVYSYDENGTLIDMERLDYLLFIDLTKDSSQQISPIQKIRHRMHNRIQTRIQNRLFK